VDSELSALIVDDATKDSSLVGDEALNESSLTGVDELDLDISVNR
jgi:hypothetical protein